MTKFNIPAIVIGLNATSLGIIRELGRRGVEVVAMDHVSGPARRSRFCRPVICPSIVCEPDAFLDALLKQISSCDRPVVFPSNDLSLKFVIKHYDALHQLVRFPFGNPAVTEKVLSKDTLYHMASIRNVLLPRTIVLNDQKDIHEADKLLGYPLVVKASISAPFEKQTGKKVLIIQSRDQLCETFRRLRGIHTLLAQELVKGPDCEQYSCALYINKEGIVAGVFAARKLRSYPTGFGVGTCVESIPPGPFCKIAVDFLQTISYSGIAEVEFKRDLKRGQYQLIEINARSWAQNSLAEKCGMPLSFLAYQDAIGIQLNAVEKYVAGIKWISLKKDIWAASKYRADKNLSISGYVSSLSSVKSFSIYATDDPLPAVFTTITTVIQLPRKLCKTAIRFLRRHFKAVLSKLSLHPSE